MLLRIGADGKTLFLQAQWFGFHLLDSILLNKIHNLQTLVSEIKFYLDRVNLASRVPGKARRLCACADTHMQAEEKRFWGDLCVARKPSFA
ncbi:MAG: hypothetical protein LBC83_05635 [Oscillospiraceae bacterium]|jgi:hypothetical protein|nr:hypothetical protein [Oscillospiraceae bacterium]